MKKFRTAFITGLLILVPFMATIDILRWFVRAVDTAARSYIPNFILKVDFPGFGVLLALVLIFIIGVLTQNFVGQWLVHLVDVGMRRLPVIGGLYSGIKKFLETILNPKSDKFNGVVLIQFPREGTYSIGFRTGKPDAKLAGHGKNLVNVFVPCTPNPTSGFYLLVDEAQLVPLQLTVQEAFRVVVSMGIVTSEEAHLTP
jgi:uncharacterized membrane protein